MAHIDTNALKLLACALWLIILDVGLLLILHSMGYIVIPFLPPIH